MDDFNEVVLTADSAEDKDLFIAPGERHFAKPAPVEFNNIHLRVGNRPIVRNLSALYLKSGRALPAELQVLMAYDLWLVMFSVGIIAAGQYDWVKQFGCHIEYEKHVRTTVLDVFPQSRFISGAEFDVGASADIDMHGELQTPDVKVPLGEIEEAGGQAKIQLATKAKIAARISMRVLTPVITAAGLGSDYSEWIFCRDDKPLVGDQQLTQIIMVPNGTKKLKCKATLSAVITTLSRLFIVPIRLKSSALPLEVLLK